MSGFELSFRNRIPDYDDQYRKRWFDEEKGDGPGPATINLLRPPMARDSEVALPVARRTICSAVLIRPER